MTVTQLDRVILGSTVAGASMMSMVASVTFMVIGASMIGLFFIVVAGIMAVLSNHLTRDII